jgi:hypothetical protein
MEQYYDTIKRGDNMKICPRCKQLKELKRHGYCTTCNTARVKEWAKANPEKDKANRKRYLKSHPEVRRKQSKMANDATKRWFYEKFGLNMATHSGKVRRLVRKFFEREGLGRILEDYQIVHHIDLDPRNNPEDGSNWQICNSHEEHMKIHKELREHSIKQGKES